MELQGLDYSPGLAIQLKLWRAHGLPVSNSSPSSRPFFLVVSFGHCKFHLCSTSVSLLFQATIGGSALDFAVHALGERVFRFSVSSGLVGHFIYNLRFLSVCPTSFSFTSGTMEVLIGSWNGKGSKQRKRVLGSPRTKGKLLPLGLSLILISLHLLEPMLFPSELLLSSVGNFHLLPRAIRVASLLSTGWISITGNLILGQFLQVLPRFLVHYQGQFVLTRGVKVTRPF